MRDVNEYKKLEDVREDILAKMAVLGKGLAAKRTGVLETRKEMWREARIVLRDFDDVADLTIFAEEVARHERQYVEASEEIKKLGKMLDSPYFARIDFIEGGSVPTENPEGSVVGPGPTERQGRGDSVPTENVYIGRHSLFDEKNHLFHVYDWRAPISGLYYDYGVGAASFTVPGTGAKISGEITLKRQYQIEKGELVYLFDNDIAIEDDILRLELSKSSEAHIKTIVNTIQADQNQAIRAESGDILVYGPAGSGKTSVGLHRLAYLLYRFRAGLSSSKVRIFSPGPIFSSYIEGIIPELGEEDVLTLDFPALLRTSGKNSRGGRGFRGPYQMIEAISLNEDDIRVKWISAKFSAEFLDGLEKVISEYTPAFEDVIFYTDKLCDKERLAALYQDRTVSGTLASKTERVISYVARCFAEYLSANFRKVTEIFNSIHDENFSDSEIRSKFDEEKNICMADLRNRLMPPAAKIFEKYLRTAAKTLQLAFAPARDALRMDNLFYEDALSLFYIELLTGRVGGEKTVKHILLDEAQDLSILHHRILRRLYPASRFTVLADTNQALYHETNIHDINTLQNLYPAAEVIPLTKSYRSTYEIMRFATKLLNPASQHSPTCEHEISAFLRHGEEPVIVKTSNTVAAVSEIIKSLPDSYNTVGILLPTITETKAFYTKFKNCYPRGNTPRPLTLISADSENFLSGVMIMAVPFAKGLEFDVVIAPHFTPAYTPKTGKLMYLICTRALHRLFLIEENIDPHLS